MITATLRHADENNRIFLIDAMTFSTNTLMPITRNEHIALGEWRSFHIAPGEWRYLSLIMFPARSKLHVSLIYCQVEISVRSSDYLTY